MRILPLAAVVAWTFACGAPPAGSDGGSDGGPGGDAGLPDSGVPDAGCGGDVAPDAGLVVTTSGAVQGAVQGGAWAFLGVPYALPPVGDLRWRAPQPASCWSGARPATSYGAKCPQLEADGGFIGQEDCLTLNVWRKDAVSGAPVMVFVHGGGNVQGSSSEPYYDGKDLAARFGVVVVTLNYRLGALGFLASPALDAENDAGVSGNYGLLDQQLALEWVKANAARFGGDPARVLLFGESAGAQDTVAHLVAPGSAGLFSAALVESGGDLRTTLAQAEAEMQPVAQSAGCASASGVAACLRGASAETLTRVPAAIGPLEHGLHYAPVIDGVVVPGD